jgi:N-acetylmuramoyl-L-alanine amidase
VKDYIGNVVDLTGDARINPATLDFGDGEGSHGRDIGVISSISVHHDAAARPHDYDSVTRYVQEAAGDAARLGPGLPYHYRIDNTGVIFACRPLTTWLNCVGSAENVTTVAICLDGYFNAPVNETPTREQYEALGQLLVNLCEQHPEFPATYPDVRPHRDFSSTDCPGDLFAPWVYAVKDKATATAVPDSAVYDWPDLQPGYQAAPAVPSHVDAAVTPSAPAEATPDPAPTPPAPTPPLPPAQPVPGQVVPAAPSGESSAPTVPITQATPSGTAPGSVSGPVDSLSAVPSKSPVNASNDNLETRLQAFIVNEIAKILNTPDVQSRAISLETKTGQFLISLLGTSTISTGVAVGSLVMGGSLASIGWVLVLGIGLAFTHLILNAALGAFKKKL